MKKTSAARVKLSQKHPQGICYTRARGPGQQVSFVRPFLPLGIVLFYACASANMPQVTIHPQNGQPVQVAVEIVNTPQKRAFGLMYRKDLSKSQGMLFVFPREEPLSFWMKNTPLPLDIVFINSAHTVVNIAANTTPFSEEPLPSAAPAQFVIEVNAGFCQKHGITAGARVDLPGVQPPAT